MAYTPQYYPGSTSVGINRRKHMSSDLEGLRDLTARPLIESGKPAISEKKIQKLIRLRGGNKK